MMPATYQLLVTALMELFPDCPIRIQPNSHSYFEMDHYIEWKLNTPLPPTSIFYLKKSRDSRNAMLAREVQRIHRLPAAKGGLQPG